MFFFIFLACLLISQPFNLTILLLILSATLGIIAGNLLSKWLFISIFMIFLGGMMILFFYLVSLATPTKFLTPNKLYLSVFIFLAVIASSALNQENNQLTMLTQMYAPLSSQIIVWLSGILMLSLLTVVKLTENFKGSLVSMW